MNIHQSTTERYDWLDSPTGQAAVTLANSLRRLLTQENITEGWICGFRFGGDQEDPGLRIQLRDTKDQLANLHDTVSAVLQQRDQHESELRDTKQQLDAANTRIEMLARTVREQEGEIDNLKSDLAAARSNEKNMQQKTNGAVARAEELRTSRDHHFQAKRDLQQKLLTAQSKIETLTADLTMSLRGQTALEEKLDQACERNIMLRNQLDAKPAPAPAFPPSHISRLRFAQIHIDTILQEIDE